MSTLLVRHATVLVTYDDGRREIADGGLFARDGVIVVVGPTAELPDQADEVLDLTGHVVLPGLVNTHHHLYQSLTRAVPGTQDADLFEWLVALYPIWARLTPEAVRVSTVTGLAELALSGCTTTSDHLYVFPNGCRLDDEIEAATEVGLRFHATRGSMSLGESRGGLPPDRCAEDEGAILADSQRLIERYHDTTRGALLRIALAPCSPFSVTADLMRQTAALARAYGVGLHTHLAETVDEERFCLETAGLRPVAYMETLGWLGADVWFAHSVHVDDGEIQAYARTGTGVAHCPTSNMRLASGIAPVQAMRAAGVKVGVGVDGSASNDGAHLLAEARQAMLLARLRLGERRRRGSGAAPGEAAAGAPPRANGAAGAQTGADGAPTRADVAPTRAEVAPTRAEVAAAVAAAADGSPASEALMSAREALEIATLGGAAVLGRDDIGALAPGRCADFFALDLAQVGFAGALHDPVAAVLLCAPATAAYTYVHGRAIVREGHVVTVDLPRIIERHNQIARAMVGGE